MELYSPYAKSSACNNSNPATKIVDSLLRPDDGVKSGLHSEGYLGMGSIVCWGYARKTLSDDVTASIRITVVVKTAWETLRIWLSIRSLKAIETSFPPILG